MWNLLDALGGSRKESLLIPHRPVASPSEYEVILAAIVNHNPERARQAMFGLLKSVEQSINSSRAIVVDVTSGDV
jgi:DNA-binding FadR family transcriptional regulator